jgi:hypothetical protein
MLETALEGNTKGAFEENVFFGKIFMAIDNLSSRCAEVNNSIKVAKVSGGKKTDKESHKPVEIGEDGKPVEKKEKNTEAHAEEVNQLLNIDAAVRKLGVVSDNIMDFLKLINNQDKNEKGRKGLGGK